MDITGAAGTTTAEAILQLRALHANRDLDEYWKYHLQEEQHRNHRLATTWQPYPSHQRSRALGPLTYRVCATSN